MSGLSTYKRVLAAGEGQDIAARGTLIVLRECLSAITISLIENQTSGRAGGAYTLVLRRGEKVFAPQEFDQVHVRNETTTAQNVELLIGSGDYVQPPPDIASADQFVGRPPVVCDALGTLIVDENPTRKRVLVKAMGSNADIVTVAGSQADAAAGNGFGLDTFEVYPGEARGPLWGASASGASIVFVLEEIFNT